jgi:hypothetical protein
MNESCLLARRIDNLRRALREGSDFGSVVDLFQSSLADSPLLRDASVQARDPVIEKAIATGVRTLLNTDEPVVLLLFHVPAHGMWHGFSLSGGMVGGFFGFDATRQLCLCLPDDGGLSHYLRITWTSTPFSGTVRGSA